MIEETISIISKWKSDHRYNNDIPIESIDIKYCNTVLGIYTLYFMAETVLVKIKAFKNNTSWKITELL